MGILRLLFFVCSVSCPWASYAANSYAIHDLGVLGGMNTSSASDINDSGQVAGVSSITSLGITNSRAVWWNDNVITELGTLGGQNSVARGISDFGQVVGSSNIVTGSSHAFLWSEGAIVDLGTLGGSTSHAFGINNSGQVVGWSFDDDSFQRAFFWNGAGMSTFDALGGATSMAIAINDSGQVVGQYLSGGQFQAFLLSGNSLINLGTFGGAGSIASGLNSSGQVVGRADTDKVIFDPEGNPVVVQHAFLWDGVSKIDLGTLGGSNSWAQAINDSGRVVGFSSMAGDFVTHAFMWDNNVLVDLNDLLPAGSGWTLTDARAINSIGQIVGTGVIGGQTHAFLMTPVPVPPALWLFVSGLVTIAGWCRGYHTAVGRTRPVPGV